MADGALYILASVSLTGLPLPCARLRGISRVGRIPAVRMAAISSRSSISKLSSLRQPEQMPRILMKQTAPVAKIGFEASLPALTKGETLFALGAGSNSHLR